MSKKRKIKAAKKSKRASKIGQSKRAPPPTTEKPKTKPPAINPYAEKPTVPSPFPGPFCTFGCRGNPTSRWVDESGKIVEVCTRECTWLAKRRGWKPASTEGGQDGDADRPA